MSYEWRSAGASKRRRGRAGDRRRRPDGLNRRLAPAQAHDHPAGREHRSRRLRARARGAASGPAYVSVDNVRPVGSGPPTRSSPASASGTRARPSRPGGRIPETPGHRGSEWRISSARRRGRGRLRSAQADRQAIFGARTDWCPHCASHNLLKLFRAGRLARIEGQGNGKAISQSRGSPLLAASARAPPRAGKHSLMLSRFPRLLPHLARRKRFPIHIGARSSAFAPASQEHSNFAPVG